MQRHAHLLRANAVAAELYLSLGFVPTGALDDEFGEPTYILKGARAVSLGLNAFDSQVR